VTPLFLFVAGGIATAAGIVVLATYGSSYRVGRLLAATPKVSLDDALALAASGDRRYVRVDGRLDSDQDFPDDHQQPLVYRRRRLELRRRGRWQTLDEQLEAVPFEIREGLSSIGIDNAALDHGLVVLPREATGKAGEITERVPAGTPASTPARYRVDQVSSIEHAIVLGVPVRTGSGAQLTSGFGRPLVLSTLEIPEAMRVLGRGRSRPVAVLALIGGGLGLIVIALLWALISTLR